MKNFKTYFLIGLTLCVLPVLCSCDTHNPKNSFKFSGKTSTISETAEAVYIYSLAPSSDVKKQKNFIGCYDKSGNKYWEQKMEFSGDVYPLKDGQFFFANQDGQVAAYDPNGRKLWEKKLDITIKSNSHYLLNSHEELMVNLLSSPNNITEYLIINISGDTKTSSPINATSIYTYNYPKGGYITEGYVDYNWSISKIRADFTLEWVYHANENEDNIQICDISKDGQILFSGTKGNGLFLKQLNEEGAVLNSADFQASNVQAKYFQDHIIAAADTIMLFNENLSIIKQGGDVKFPRIKVCGDSAFIYSIGSYSSSSSVVYDGYCIEFDANLRLLSEKIFKQTDRFIGVSDDGVAYYKK